MAKGTNLLLRELAAALDREPRILEDRRCLRGPSHA